MEIPVYDTTGYPHGEIVWVSDEPLLVVGAMTERGTLLVERLSWWLRSWFKLKRKIMFAIVEIR